MGVIEFIPKGGLTPIFGIKLSPSFSEACEYLKEIEAETLVKKVLNINENRAVSLKEVEDNFGNTFQLLIVYDQISKKSKAILKTPHTEDGYFDFPIYNCIFELKTFILTVVIKGKHLLSFAFNFCNKKNNFVKLCKNKYTYHLKL